MPEFGESVSVPKSVPDKTEKGDLKVSVRDVCVGMHIKNAKVTINGKTKETDEYGVTEFSDLSVGVTSVRVKAHLKDMDYSTFIIHYPRVLSAHSAKSAGEELVEIIADANNKVRVELEVFRYVGEIVFHRRQLDLDPNADDKYGHWWTVVDSKTSFGWWPKHRLGAEENRLSEPPKPPAPLLSGANIKQEILHRFDKALYSVKSKIYNIKESSLGQTLRGVEGVLNSELFGGTEFRDPHHVGDDEGDEQYKPVRDDCFDLPTIKESIENFARTYSGGWSWRFEAGNHCHTFQKKLMSQCKLQKVKVIK